MKKIGILLLLCAIFPISEKVLAFCGFYVAQAGVNLFNESSQVIIVKDGTKMTVTMANDYKGDAKDFAMVVPVPVVLQKDDIRIKENYLFERFSAYSAPRLTEYYDENPCYPTQYRDLKAPTATKGGSTSPTEKPSGKKDLGVKVEAQYQVGEYNILILSANESSGLETWLTQNGYKIPAGAKEVLEPYIKAKLKFFVVKVDLKKQTELGYSYLRPIQIAYKSANYMLPIRLGMANSKGVQDLVIYTITKQGRTETTNYRTVRMSTDTDIPTFVRSIFGEFYKAAFQKKWLKEGKNAVFLEYAWDISTNNPMKCDPCASPPVSNNDLIEAGVDWLNNEPNRLFFTRLHVRYDRDHFPQDLAFQETPNKERFQCRYVLHQPARGGLDCEAGKKYKEERLQRQAKELANLYELTGWNTNPQFEGYRKTIEGIEVSSVEKSRLMPVKDPNPFRLSAERKMPTKDSVAKVVVAINDSSSQTAVSSDSNSQVAENDTNIQETANTETPKTEAASSSTSWFTIIGTLIAAFLGTLAAGFLLRKKGGS